MASSIAKDSLKLTLSRIITTLISLVTAMLLARFRTLEEYGTYSQILLVINVTNALLMFGLPNSINYFLARTDNKQERIDFLSIYYTLSTLLSIVVGIVLMLSASLISDYFSNPLIKSFIYVLAFYPWTQIVMAGIDNILIVYKKTSALVKFRIIHSLFLVLLIIVIRLLNLNFNMYMYCLIAGEAVFALSVYFIVIWLEGEIKFRINWAFLSKLLGFSIPIGLASAVGTLHVEFDKLFIGRYFDTQQLAVYANASKELPVSIISGSITAVLLPQMVRFLKEGKKKEGVRIWGKSIVLSYIFICLIAAGTFVFAPQALTILYSAKYIEGTDVFRVYCITLLLKCTYFGTILNSAGKTKLIFISSLISLLINIALNFLFYSLLGFIGPAVATLITTIAVALFQLLASAKTITYPFKAIFPWKDLYLITGINIIFAAIFFAIGKWLPLERHLGDVMEAVILGLVWISLYFILMFRKTREAWSALN